MNKPTTLAAKILIAIAVLMTLQACTTRPSRHIEFKTEYIGIEQRWDSDSKAKEENVRNIEFGNFNVINGSLHFSPQTHYILQEYNFEHYEEYDRTHFGPKWNFILFPVIGWMACLFDITECFGWTTDWSDWSSSKSKNEQPNGNIQEKTYSKLPYDTTVSLAFSGQLPSGKVYTSPSEKLWRGVGPVDVKRKVQKWPEKPTTLSVQFNIAHKEESYDTRYDFTDTEIASLTLESDSWNSHDENRHKYFYQLTSALKAENHSAALAAFKKLEDMDFEKPESFWYRYALSAKKAGKPDIAATKARQYLKVAIKRTYEKEATVMIPDIK
ncbi:Uncharacterised protein [Zhongshania aliphaticivorans]|uniref:Uncharacterized protein n=1 Tax=Zhongshania aliphaticivorans TaxID=1470434 RepID=A0A5S9Q2C5_9GAMM|nr:tetratricopeptide repeat protein [Zhongshania aliphaticivorans]CAA0093376.1 Uncharacterised protein [Zhongshania aliphaticivorans]CAA0111233.1 Uncharacterised protein [Zhongshania aliphaticivorans]